ncbi:MAG: hypothetical protein C0168_10370 [Candidatus Aminicenantes bacterium]|nr:MAG: hypothetical protein C0168_10370 [Candidatus Aminicenantes bacterium]
MKKFEADDDKFSAWPAARNLTFLISQGMLFYICLKLLRVWLLRIHALSLAGMIINQTGGLNGPGFAGFLKVFKKICEAFFAQFGLAY